jgi:3-(3-hydroxy-phenyl)propionate hydroxylase
LEFVGGEFTVVTFVPSARADDVLEAELRTAGVHLPLRLVIPADSVRLGEVGPANVRPNGPRVHRAMGATVLLDIEGLVHERYGGKPGVTYLIRPDQHVAARFADFDANALRTAHHLVQGGDVGVSTFARSS